MRLLLIIISFFIASTLSACEKDNPLNEEPQVLNEVSEVVHEKNNFETLLTPLERRAINNYLFDDFETFYSNGKSVVGELTDSSAYIYTTAKEINTDYKANEISADMKYAGKEIILSGKIDAISKDAAGKPYLLLKAAQYENVTARFDKGDETLQALAEFKKGQDITLVCDNAKLFGGSVILRDCLTVPIISQKQAEIVLNNILAKAPEDELDDVTLYVTFFTVLQVSNYKRLNEVDETCSQDDCDAIIKAASTVNIDEEWVKQEYESYMNERGLTGLMHQAKNAFGKKQ